MYHSNSERKLSYNWDSLDWPNTEQIPVQPGNVASVDPQFLVHLEYSREYYYRFWIGLADIIRGAYKYIGT